MQCYGTYSTLDIWPSCRPNSLGHIHTRSVHAHTAYYTGRLPLLHLLLASSAATHSPTHPFTHPYTHKPSHVLLTNSAPSPVRAWVRRRRRRPVSCSKPTPGIDSLCRLLLLAPEATRKGSHASRAFGSPSPGAVRGLFPELPLCCSLFFAALCGCMGLSAVCEKVYGRVLATSLCLQYESMKLSAHVCVYGRARVCASVQPGDWSLGMQWSSSLLLAG